MKTHRHDETSINYAVAGDSKLPMEKVILIGHSMGGAVNLVAATMYPEPIIGFIGIDNFKAAG